MLTPHFHPLHFFVRNFYPYLLLNAIFLLGASGTCLWQNCPHRSQMRQFISPAPPPVTVGYYPEYHHPLPENHFYSPKIRTLRQDIESNESLLCQLVQKHIPVKSHLEFRFSYAGYDSLNKRLILRYFAPNPAPGEIAGWQVQIIYRLPKLILERAFVWAVPLE
jgi:hypothetical protein